MDRNFTKDSTELINYVRQAFAHVPGPMEWEGLSSIQDFQRAFGDDFFSSIGDTIYSWDLNDIKYIIPFSIEFYVLHYKDTPEIGHRAEMLMLMFQQPNHEVEPIRHRLNEIYDSFNGKESEAFCRFFKFIKKYDLGLYEKDIDIAIQFWCEKGHESLG